MTSTLPKEHGSRSKPGHGPVSTVNLWHIKPAPENDTLYRPVDSEDPEIVALAESIRKHGLREPIVVSADGYILSGHRRYTACESVGLLEVPVRFESISRCDDPDGFLTLLREHNRQRVKTLAERLREEIVSGDPEESYAALLEHRHKMAQVDVSPLAITGTTRRCAITAAKQPFLEAIQNVLNERREFWPLSDRQIHYALLNAPPLRHAKKPDSTYANDQRS